MTLSLKEGSPGPPWDRRGAGKLEQLTVTSELLSGNALGDSADRPLWVYLPPGVDHDRVPSIYLIQGYTGQVDSWLNRNAFEPNMVERLDELFGDESVPRAIVVFVDAWTAYGGSQFVNSTATGPYMDYLCDEVVPFVDANYPTAADPGRRALAGKSSGGYGAMVVPMMRPDVFGAFASHAGDALFEVSYLPDFREAARRLRDDFEGSWDVFLDRVFTTEWTLEFDKFWPGLMIYGMAAAYTPDPDRPGRGLMPFEAHTGRLIDDVWERWLEWDPVRMAPQKADALGGMKLVYLDAGDKDEYFLDLGARAFADELDKLGVQYTFELFPGKHGGIQHRYPKAIKALAEALAR
ncbi:MAG: enterochelin esterase [Actinobacteria bacterium]|nr:enterochelin esterase [Actinomycetota bacterium]